MKYEPCARLTTRITPKINESPLASRKSSAPYDRPLKVWVTQNSRVTGSPRLRLRLARPPSQPQEAPRVLRQDAGPGARGALCSAHADPARPPRAHGETGTTADQHATGPDETREILQRRRTGAGPCV